MNFQTINRQRKFILITAAIGVISVFLPWMNISIFGITQSSNGFHGLGILVFILFLAEGIITWMGNQAQPLEKNYWFLVILSGVIALLSVIIKISSFSNTPGEEIGMATVGLGIGMWLSLACSAAVILFAWLFKNPADNLKSGLEGLKRSISIPASSLSDAAFTTNHPVLDKIEEFKKLRSVENKSIQKSEDQTSL